MNNATAKSARLAEGTLLFLAALWGSSFIAAHSALEAGFSPAFILMCRFILSAVFVGLVFRKRIAQNFAREHLKAGLLLGALFFLTFYANILGLKYSTPSNNAFITASNVAIVPFFWWFIRKQRPLGIMFASCALSFLGIAVISLDFSGGALWRLGDLLSFVSAIIAAAHIVAMGETARRMDPCLLVFLQFAVGAVFATVFFFVTDGDLSSFSNTRGMLAVVYLAVFCTCVCFLLQAWAMTRVNPARSAVILSTEAIFGSLWSVLAGIDRLTPRLALGGLVVTFAIILPELRYWAGMKNEKGDEDMARKAVTSEKASAIGPYSHGVDADGFVYLSGQTPIDPATGKLVEGDVGAQTQRSFDNLFEVLAAAGLTPEHVQKVNVYLTDMNDFAAMNEVYKKQFSQPYPARTTVGVAQLPLGARVEIELVAKRG